MGSHAAWQEGTVVKYREPKIQTKYPLTSHEMPLGIHLATSLDIDIILPFIFWYHFAADGIRH